MKCSMDNAVNAVYAKAFTARFSPEAERYIADKISSACKNSSQGSKIKQMASNLKSMCDTNNPYLAKNDIVLSDDIFFFSGGNNLDAPYETCVALSKALPEKHDDFGIVKLLSDIYVELEKLSPQKALQKIGISFNNKK